MATYQFRCPSCRAVYSIEGSVRDDIPQSRPCPRCGFGGSKRDYSFNLQPSFTEHFNHSLGEYVTNNRSFEDGLKRQSAMMSERMSQDVNYTPLSPSEMAEASSHGVTEEGLYESRKAMHDSIQ
jgi:rubredoxin